MLETGVVVVGTFRGLSDERPIWMEGMGRRSSSAELSFRVLSGAPLPSDDDDDDDASGLSISCIAS
jgi:hypothetical protein